ncbi:MAG: type II toxin-antitoxin system HicB family antitoxin [Pseudolabrys sp.]|jgi:predicted RNase H-like HicB family nuclease
MTHYIALIHKDADSCYGVSFPDVPGVFTAGDTIDEAIAKAAEVLAFAAEDWSDLDGKRFPAPRTIDELRTDPDFEEQAPDAVIAAIPFHARADAVA